MNKTMTEAQGDKRFYTVLFIAYIVGLAIITFGCVASCTSDNAAPSSTYQVFWENVGGGRTYRHKVPGGWLVSITRNGTGGQGLCFYPDPEHKWEIK